MPALCNNTNCTNFRSRPNQHSKGYCNIYHLMVDKNGMCREIDPIVISVDAGHGTLNKNRHCPECEESTILHDSGWEYCSVCKWKTR